MKVSASKFTRSLITPHADEYNLQPTITLNNIPIPYTDTATTLGVIYDKKMRFTSHTDNINTKAKTRLNASEHSPMQHSANPKNTSPQGTNSKYFRPILTYAHLAWQLDTETTHIKNYKSPKIERFKSQLVAHKQPLSLTSTKIHWYSLSSNTCL